MLFRSSPGQGRVYAVHAVRAGGGATYVTVNLALALAAEGDSKVGVVDLNLRFPNVAPYLAPESPFPRTFADIYDRLDTLEARLVVERYMYSHPSGLRVLFPAHMPADTEHVRAEHVYALIETLRPQFDYLVIDTPAHIDEETQAALEAASTVVVVAGLDAASVAASRAFLAQAGQIGLRSDRLLFLANRSTSEQLAAPLVATEKLLGHSFVGDVPDQFNAAFNSELGKSHPAQEGWSNDVGRSFSALASYLKRMP